jgi:phytoene synthase
VTPVSPAALARSTAACRRLGRRANSSFPAAFRLLPRTKADGMASLYAFFRLCDDIADEPGDPAAKRASLDRWRAGLNDATRGVYAHRTHAALADTLSRFNVPVGHLHAVIDGVRTDLEPRRYANFDELYPYCYRVASAVGLACVPVWGTAPGADPAAVATAAEAAGIAFQLTNILRDFGEDRAAGRVYLPADEFARFGLTPEACDGPEFARFVAFQVERAERFYEEGAKLAPLLSVEGRRIFTAMSDLYRMLLRKVARRPYDVTHRRLRLPRTVKVAILIRAWLR